MSIQKNLQQLLAEVPSEVKVIAVSKTQPVEKIREALISGHRIFGENRAQELARKYQELPTDIEWHMIGHLQTNKIKYIAPFVSLIHSVDSDKLLMEINRQAAKVNRVISCLLQVHIAAEETKFGFSEEEVTTLMASPVWGELSNVRIQGLMGMATFTGDEDQIRGEFRRLRSLFELLRTKSLPAAVVMKDLSMGMSGDYKIAIDEGSTMIRVGTAIFGERTKH